MEDGTIILIGATTENPYFEVNNALISRSVVLELKPLSREDVAKIILVAVNDSERGLGSFGAQITDEAVSFLSDAAGGDARRAINAVELGITTTPRSEDGIIHLTLDVVSECIQKKAIRYDADGDEHYDTISAFIKSMRGSDPDAAVYYLARMLSAGEDIKFIARRIMICASEDVGNADPMAMVVAASAAAEVERVGMPESQLILSQAAIYVATAPKSNSSCVAIEQAMKYVEQTANLPIPPYLQDAHYKGSAKLGRGVGYMYPHDFPGHYVAQRYLPEKAGDITFYAPSDEGFEKEIKNRMDKHL